MVLEVVPSAQDSPICYLCSRAAQGNSREELSGKASLSGRQSLPIRENADLDSLSATEQSRRQEASQRASGCRTAPFPETLVGEKEKTAH